MTQIKASMMLTSAELRFLTIFGHFNFMHMLIDVPSSAVICHEINGQ
jgi:hypothetical protein